MSIKASEDIIKKIKQHEGFSPVPYEDVTGKLTIGYGSTEYGDAQELDETSAENMMRQRVALAEKELSSVIKRTDLSQSQQDVLIDMHYNLGASKIQNVLNRVNSGDDEGVLEAIRQYTKARDKKTGELKDFPGLIKRKDMRVSLWESGMITPEQRALEEIITADIGNQDLAQNLPNIDEVAGNDDQAQETFDLEAMIVQDLDGANNAQYGPPLSFMEGAEDQTELEKRAQAKILAKRTGMSEQDAYEVLETSTLESEDLKKDRGFIERNFPDITRWAQNPDNYTILTQVGGKSTVLGISRALMAFYDWAKDSPFIEDLSNAAINGTKKQLAETKAVLSYKTGIKTKAETIKDLRTIDAMSRVRMNYNRQEEMNAYRRDLEKEGVDVADAFERTRQEFNQLSDAYYAKDGEAFIQNIKDLYKAGKVSREEVLDYMWALVKSPKDLAIMSAESLGSSVAPFAGQAIGAGIGLGVGAFSSAPSGPFALIGGGIGAFSGGAITAYTQSLMQMAREYRAPDGTIDYERFFNDPEAMEKAHEKSMVYGVAMGVADVVLTRLAGRFVKNAKPVRNIDAPSNILKVTAKETIQGAVGESAQEAVAQSAVLTYGNVKYGEDITAKDIANLTTETIAEAVLSGPSTGAIGVLSGATQKIYNEVFGQENIKAKGEKLFKVIKESEKSARNYMSLRELRKTLKESKIAEKYPEQIKELIKEGIKRNKDTAEYVKRTKEEPPAPIKESPDPINPTQEEIQEVIDRDPYADEEIVTVSASDFNMILVEAGLDPEEVLSENAPIEVYRAYQEAKDNGGEFTIPLSDYVVMTDKADKLDALVRLGDSEFNGIESEEIARSFDEDPFALFLPDDRDEEIDTRAEDELPTTPEERGEEVPPTPTRDEEQAESETEFIQGESEGILEEPVLRPVQLLDRFRNDKERAAYRKLRSQFKRSINKIIGEEYNADFDKGEIADFLAEIQFRHARFRANLLGQNLDEVMDTMTIRPMNEREIKNMNAYGFFRPMGFSATRFWEIAYNPEMSLNTAVHELGHSWFYEMAADYDYIHAIAEDQLTPEQREYKEAMRIAFEEFGDFRFINEYPSNNDPEFAEKMYRITAAQERFAQTTEKWFMEGNIGNTRIRKLMGFFRKWLVRIGVYVGENPNYVQYGSAPVTKDIERMFQILTDSDKKIEEAVYPLLPEGEFDPDMLGPRKQEYLDAIKDVKDEAIARVYARMFQRSIREREKIIDNALTTAEEQAIEEVDRSLGMEIYRMFRDAYQDFKDGTLDEDPRISYKSFVETFFNGDEEQAMNFKRTIPREFVAGKNKKGGVDARIVMQMYGITDPIDLIAFMEEAASRQDLIDETATRILNENYPIFKTDEEIHEIAVEEMNRESKRKYLNIGMRHMADQYLSTLKGMVEQIASTTDTLRRRMDQEAIREEAFKVLRDKDYKTFKAKDFINQSNRIGQQAARKFVKGNFEEAFEDKYRQVVLYEAFKMAQEIEKIRAKGLVAIKKINRSDLNKIAKRYDINIWQYANAAIELFKSGRLRELPEFSAKDMMRFPELVSDAQVQQINDLISKMKLGMSGRAEDWMTIEGFVDFTNVLQALIRLARNAKSLEIKDRNINLDEAARDIAESLILVEKGGRPNDVREVGRIEGDLINLRTFFGGLFKNEEDYLNSIFSSVYEMMRDGSSDYANEFNGGKDRIIRALKKASKGERSFKNEIKGILSGIPIKSFQRIVNPPIPAQELGISFKGKSEILMFLLYMGSESGAEKLLRGGTFESQGPLADYDFTTGKIKEDAVWAMVNRFIEEGILKEEDFDALQTIWDEFEKHHDDVRRVMREVDGREIGTIPPREISVIINGEVKTWKGGYIPVAADRSYLSTADVQNILDVDGKSEPIAAMYPSQNVGFTKQRTQTHYPVNLDLGKITFQLSTHVKIAKLRKPMYNISKIMSHPMVKSSLEQRRPNAYANRDGEGLGIVPETFQRVLRQQYSEYKNNFIQRFAAKARRAAYPLIFIGNYISMLSQFAGFIPAAKIGGGRAISRGAKTLTSYENIKSNVEMIRNKSTFMKSRFKTHELNQLKSWEYLDTNFTATKSLNEVLERISFLPMQMAQTLVDGAVWRGVYDDRIAKGDSEQDAIRKADDVVERSQGSTDISAMSKIMHGSDLQRLFTMIGNYPISMFNVNFEAYLRKDMPIEKIKAYAGMMVFTALLPSMVTFMIREIDDELWDDGEDDDEDNLAEDFALAMGTDMLQISAPILSRPITSFMYRGDINFTPAGKLVDATKAAVRGLGTIGSDVEMTPYEMKGLFGLMTLLGFNGGAILSKGVGALESFESESDRNRRNRIRRRQRAAERRRER